MSTSRPDNALATHAAGDNSRQWSLRTRLIALLLLATTGLWALAAYSVYQEAELESEQLFDESLQETAYLLLTVVEHEMAEHGVDYAAQLIDSADMPKTHYLRFQIWDRNNQLIYRSQDAPLQPMVKTAGVGYALAGSGNEALRTFVAWNAERQLQIQVGEPLSHRHEIMQRTLWRLALIGAVCLPLTVFFIWWIISRSFAPIQWTSEAVAIRTGQQLDDVDMGNVPREIAPLIRAINRLLGRIRETLQHERRFTADAAHELRTPLAAIRAHAQVLQGARTAEEASEAAQDIITGVDRSRRLVDQLLALARLESVRAVSSTPTTMDLVDVVRQQVTDHQPFAESQGISLSVDAQPAVMQGHPDHLQVLLRNLIDNALRYTPEGGEVQVSCGTDSGDVYLAVRDSGIGIPETERQRIFERFYRINRLGDRNTYGSGLGLSIVQRLVEQHGAQIRIEEGLHGKGVSFVVRFSRQLM